MSLIKKKLLKSDIEIGSYKTYIFLRLGELVIKPNTGKRCTSSPDRRNGGSYSKEERPSLHLHEKDLDILEGLKETVDKHQLFILTHDA